MIRLIYRLTAVGETLAAIRLPGFQPEATQGLVFGPSVDSTGDPSAFHLYIAADSGPNKGVMEWRVL